MKHIIRNGTNQKCKYTNEIYDEDREVAIWTQPHGDKIIISQTMGTYAIKRQEKRKSIINKMNKMNYDDKENYELICLNTHYVHILNIEEAENLIEHLKSFINLRKSKNLK